MRRRLRTVMSLLAAGAIVVGCSGDDDEAEGSSGGSSASDLLQQGLAAHAQGDLEEAEDLYEQVLEQEPRNAFAHYNLGVIDQTRNEPKTAEERYRDALAIAPDMSVAAYNLAILRTQGGSYDEAVELYKQVLRRKPDAAAHFNLGLLLKQLHRDKEADSELRAAAKLDPALAQRVETVLSDPGDEDEDPADDEGAENANREADDEVEE